MKNSLSLALVCPILGSVAFADDAVQCGVLARTHIDACRRVGLWPKPAGEEASVEVTAVPGGSSRLRKCSFHTGQQQAGYVIMAADGTVPRPVMWSGSKCRDRFVAALSPVPVDAAAAWEGKDPVFAVRHSIRMIGVPDRVPEDLRPSPVACCAISLIYWSETRLRRPLLHSCERGVMLPEAPPAAASGVPERVLGELDKFHEAWMTLYPDDSLFETLTTRTGRQVYRTKDGAALFRRTASLFRETLGRDLSIPARMQVLEQQSSVALDVGGQAISPGAVNAVILQSYLDQGLEAGLGAFLKSRAIPLRWTVGKVSSLTSSRLPCLVVSPDNQAAVVVDGCLGDPPALLLVCVPETVNSERLSSGQAVRRLRQRLPAILPADSAVGKFHSSQPPQEGEDLPPAPGAPVQVDDPDASLAAGLGNGLHVVSRAALENWTTLLLSDVDTAQSRPEKH